MKFAPFGLIVAGAIALAATPATAEERTFDLPEFDRIDVSAGIMLVADVGDAQSVRVETHDGDFSDFEIEVNNGELSVSREWNRLRWHNKKADYKVSISMRELKALEASSGSHAKISNLDSANFSMDLSSGAYVTVNGNSDNCSLDLSSGANLDGKDLVCNNANIDVSSGGHGALSVRESVVADASSGGHVSVYGNPTRVNIDKSSGGRIKINTEAQANRD